MVGYVGNQDNTCWPKTVICEPGHPDYHADRPTLHQYVKERPGMQATYPRLCTHVKQRNVNKGVILNVKLLYIQLGQWLGPKIIFICFSVRPKC